jgi:hypothetical protein
LYFFHANAPKEEDLSLYRFDFGLDTFFIDLNHVYHGPPKLSTPIPYSLMTKAFYPNNKKKMRVYKVKRISNARE